MIEARDDWLEEWHRIVETKDLAALHAVLAEDVTLGAPPYWVKFEGRPLVHHLLGLILETIADFTYRREWRNGNELALEFTGHVDGLEIQAIDLITLDERGRVANLDVLMRPVNGVTELRERIAPKMAAYLAARANGGGE